MKRVILLFVILLSTTGQKLETQSMGRLAGLVIPSPTPTEPYPVSSPPSNHRCGRSDGRFAEMFARAVFMSDGSCNWDSQRVGPRILVVHHTDTDTSATPAELSRIIYQRLYRPGRRESSGHYWNINDRKVEHYVAYHELIRSSGESQKTLEDDEIGWCVGVWEMNVQAYCVAFVDDLHNHRPTPAAIARLERIADRYDIVMGHEQAKGGNAYGCPGSWFRSWLIGYLARRALRPPLETRTPNLELAFPPPLPALSLYPRI
jgi:hypothetical protein